MEDGAHLGGKLVQVRSRDVFQSVENKVLVRLVRFANELVVQVTLVLVFALERCAAPAVAIQGILVAVADVLEQSDEGFCRAVCAVRRARDDVGLDAVDVALEFVDHRDEVDGACWCPVGGLASETVTVEIREQFPRLLLDFVEVDGRAGSRGHGFTQTSTDCVVVHRESEHGCFEVALHDALLWGARLQGILDQVEPEVLRQSRRAEGGHDVSYCLGTAHAAFCFKLGVLPFELLCYCFQLAVQEVFDARELRRVAVAQQRHFRGRRLRYEATVKLIKKPLQASSA